MSPNRQLAGTIKDCIILGKMIGMVENFRFEQVPFAQAKEWAQKGGRIATLMSLTSNGYLTVAPDGTPVWRCRDKFITSAWDEEEEADEIWLIVKDKEDLREQQRRILEHLDKGGTITGEAGDSYFIVNGRLMKRVPDEGISLSCMNDVPREEWFIDGLLDGIDITLVGANTINKRGDVKQAAQWLKEGRKVRRASSPEGMHLEKADNGVGIALRYGDCINTFATLTIEDLLADDYVVA